MRAPVGDAAGRIPGTGRWPGRPERVARWLGRIIDYGTEAYPPKVRRRLKVLNVVAAIVAVSSTLFAATFALEDPGRHGWAVAINLGLAVAGAAIPFAHRHGELAGPLILLVAEYAGLFALVALVGRSSGIQLNLIVAAVISFAVLGLERIRLILAILAGGLVLHAAAWFLFPQGLVPVAPAFLTQLYLSSALTVFAVSAAIAYYAFSLAERAEAETEALLRNILPGPIVERLKERPGEAVAASHQDVSVLFSDLQGFVSLAKSLGSARTVELLNDLVRGFDGLTDIHGIEKIKTIGDAYMAVAGLPEPASDHLARLARMALGMKGVAAETAARYGVDLVLRIGMASGPVMAGVIGVRKFSYDVWGDPVNLASRLEHTCKAGCIHVPREIRDRLADQFAFAPVGLTDIKGVGPIETFLLTGPGPTAAAVQEAAA